MRSSTEQSHSFCSHKAEKQEKLLQRKGEKKQLWFHPHILSRIAQCVTSPADPFIWSSGQFSSIRCKEIKTDTFLTVISLAWPPLHIAFLSERIFLFFSIWLKGKINKGIDKALQLFILSMYTAVATLQFIFYFPIAGLQTNLFIHSFMQSFI